MKETGKSDSSRALKCASGFGGACRATHDSAKRRGQKRLSSVGRSEFSARAPASTRSAFKLGQQIKMERLTVAPIG